MIGLNLKVYRESGGARGIELCRIADQVASETGVKIMVAPQILDIPKALSECKKILIYSQHVDPNEPGAATGTLTVDALASSGAKGSLVNHAEHKIRLNDINVIVAKCRKANLETMVCTADAIESASIASMKPNYIAVEPPELIGSGVSVSTAKPEIITATVEAVRRVADVPVICGAGISNGQDIKRALELGAKGVLLASAYVKAKDPKALLTEMAIQF